MVYLCHSITDRKELEAYWSKINPTIKRWEPKILSLYTHLEHLEGDQVEGMTIIEFPTMEQAKGWYDSPDYNEIKHHRLAGGRWTGLIAEGGYVAVAERMLGANVEAVT